MRPNLRPTPIIAALLAVALALPALAQPAGREGRDGRDHGRGHGGGVLVVAGEGRVEAAPDRAIVSAGVESEAPQAAAAMAQTAAAMREVFAALEAQGVAREDMQTSQLSVSPVWDDGGENRRPRIRAYSASNLVTVRVRDLTKLGAVIDAVGASGANRIDGVTFDRENDRADRDRARRRAVEDARRKARIYAEAAGVRLGRVRSIREAGASAGPMPVMMRAEAAAMDMPVAEGVLGIEARVELVFSIR